MSNYKPHTLVSFGGVLNSLAPDHEIWQCGIRVVNAAGDPLADPGGYLLAQEVALAGWFSSAVGAAMFPLSCQLTWMKANNIGTDGKYTEDTTHVYDYNPVVAGGAGANQSMPDIIGVAVSWQTRKAIRRHSYATHGRIYLPAYLNIVLTGSMRMSTANAAAWADKGKALLQALAPASWAGGVVPVVASGHAQEVEPIIGVRCGDVFDVQRRRKDALKEVYSSVAYSGG